MGTQRGEGYVMKMGWAVVLSQANNTQSLKRLVEARKVMVPVLLQGPYDC